MFLHGGVLIIGSLLWDNAKRKKWRDNYLRCKEGVKVYLPIRYGRKSSTRENTYTMVFSTKCYGKEYGLGLGWVLPINRQMKSFAELKAQAIAMGRAEGIADGLLCRWGIVSILFNPQKSSSNTLSAEWIKLMSPRAQKFLSSMEKLKSERYPLNSNGLLTIKWPNAVDDKGVTKNFDFLFATVTSPTLVNWKKYPSVGQIVNAMKQKKYYDYFLKNRMNQITTFQDNRILKKIK